MVITKTIQLTDKIYKKNQSLNLLRINDIEMNGRRCSDLKRKEKNGGMILVVITTEHSKTNMNVAKTTKRIYDLWLYI